MISKGATNWNAGLSEACRGGYSDIANLMIDKGASNWNQCLVRACQYGHIEIRNLMISKCMTS